MATNILVKKALLIDYRPQTYIYNRYKVTIINLGKKVAYLKTESATAKFIIQWPKLHQH